jgi:hypothetical protein
MQTLKFLSVTCLGAALLAPLSSHAVPDSEAQARLREAMRKQLEQANAVTAAPAPVVPAAPAVVPPPAPKPVPAPPPPLAQPTVVVPVMPAPPAPVVAPTVNPYSEVERAALRRKMEEIQGISAPPAPRPTPAVPVVPAAPVVAPPVPVTPPPPPPTVHAPVPPTPARAPVVAPVVVPVAPPPVIAPAVVAAPVAKPGLTTKNPNAEAERAELRKKMDALVVTSPAPAPAGTPAMAPPFRSAGPVALTFTPLVAHAGMTPPASPFSGAKQGRLDELLRRYRADEITPQDYHTQRAAIIAEH